MKRTIIVAATLLTASCLCTTARLTAAQVPLSAAPAPQSLRQRDSLPVVLTIQGGGSLGVYEAGVAWTLVELFRRRYFDAATSNRFPHLYLSAVSGASAGSINALLAATQWCSGHQPTPPESSFFWHAWIPTGLPQLLPRLEPGMGEPGYGEGGMLSRAYFERVLFKRLRNAWTVPSTAGSWRHSCEVDLGATMTRLIADTMVLTPSIHAHNQRWASTVSVRTDEHDGGRTLDFRARPQDLSQLAFGKVVGLPTRRDGNVALDTLFQLFEASSGYPLAFGPQLVPFVGDSTPYPCGDARRPCDIHSAEFVDGGVFDNGPVALGLGMYFDGPFWGERIRHRETPFPYVLYVAPDSRRQLADSRTEALPQADRTRVSQRGIVAAMTLLAEAVPAARQYEIQALIRLLRSVDYPRSEVCRGTNVESCFLVQDRWHPLVGERMNGFAGFLGRPLREYDFYVGIYDALALVARYLPYDDPGSGVATPCIDAPASHTRECMQNRLFTLVAQPPVPLGSVAPCVLLALYHAEFPGAHQGPSEPTQCAQTRTDTTVTSFDAQRLVVNLTVARAMVSLMHDTTTERGYRDALDQNECGESGMLSSTLCDEGLKSIASHLRDDATTMKILRAWNAEPICRDGVALDVGWQCISDDGFLQFVDRPTAATNELVKRLLKRLDLTTPHGPDGTTVGVALVHATYLIYLTSDERYRRGVDFGQTSLPLLGSWRARLLWNALPSFVNFGVGRVSTELGWELRDHLSPDLAIVAPIRLAFINSYETGQGQRSLAHFVPGLSVEWKPGWWLNALRIDGAYWGRMGGDPGAGDWVDRLSYGATALFFSSKLRVSMASTPHIFDDYRKRPVFAEIGIGDVNGIMYWASHFHGH